MAKQPLSERDIDWLCNLVQRCGDIAIEMRDRVSIRQKSGPHDQVTDADEHLSELILEELKQRFPDDLLISEEQNHAAVVLPDSPEHASKRTWLIDPIDGTQNYINRDGQWAVMIGLVENRRPVFGCVLQPTTGLMYFGGPDYGLRLRHGDGTIENPPELAPLPSKVRLVMSWTDKRKNPWVLKLPRIKFISSGAMALKVVKILQDEADMFLSLSYRMKVWDSCAPIALALAANLDVSTVDGQPVEYPVPQIRHETSVIIGRRGTIDWAKRYLLKSGQQIQAS